MDALKAAIARKKAEMNRHAEAMLRAYGVSPPLPLGSLPALPPADSDNMTIAHAPET